MCAERSRSKSKDDEATSPRVKGHQIFSFLQINFLCVFAALRENQRVKTICPTPEETRAHAAEFAKKTSDGALILLQGDLGAGKTEWVKGFVEGAGCNSEVTSPTFTLVHEYRGGKFPVYHWDLYRLGPKTDWTVLDFHQQDPKGITIVEWPEHFPQKWPSNAVQISISILSDENRSIKIE